MCVCCQTIVVTTGGWTPLCSIYCLKLNQHNKLIDIIMIVDVMEADNIVKRINGNSKKVRK